MSIFTTIIIIIVIVFLLSGFRVVRPFERGLVERFGKYVRTADAGLTYLFPFVYKMYKIDITENIVDVPEQTIITKDDLNALVDAAVYFRVIDPQKALYKAEDYYKQITSLAQTTLRNILGKMTLSQANSERNKINEIIEKELDQQTEAWGIDIVRVEIQRIEPPNDVQESMNNVVKAEREKIAAKDFATAKEIEADGDRRAAIKKAEGSRQADILEAQGQAQAITLRAKADADAIKLVNEAADKYFKGNAQTLKKLETVSESLKDNAKVIVPSDGELVNVVGQLGGVTPVKVAKKKK